VSGPVFMFSAPGPIFGGTDGIDFCVHVLRSWTRFRRYRRRRISFSCFALSEPFTTVPTPSGLVVMFFCFGLIFGGTKGVVYHFHVLRSRTRFRRYRRRRDPFSCFALLDSFSAGPRASCPVFMSCSPGPVFGDTDGIGFRFHVLRNRTHCRRYRGCRV
jgi:hypothetical protein